MINSIYLGKNQVSMKKDIEILTSKKISYSEHKKYLADFATGYPNKYQFN